MQLDSLIVDPAKLFTGKIFFNNLAQRALNTDIMWDVVTSRGDKSLQDPTRPELETYAYLCISGRLRFLIERTVFGSKQASAIPQRYGITEKGDWFGMASVYTDNPSFHRTVICDRYCVYSLTPRYLLLAITNAFPEAAGYQCDFMARAIDRG